MKTLNKAVARYNGISLIVRILIGLIIGAVLALVAPGAGWVGELGSLFVGALKGIAPVLVFVIVASALAQGSSKLDRRFGTVIWLYMLTTFLAAAIAVVTSFMFPVTVVLADAAQSDVVPQGLGEVMGTLLTNFVANPVSAIMSGNYIGILFWACMFGVAMKKIGEPTSEKTVRIFPNPDHPQRGYCGRAAATMWIWNHPLRIRKPLKRVGERGEGKFKEVSWDEALNDIAAKLKDVVAKHGEQSVVSTSHSFSSYSKWITFPLGSPNDIGHSSTCNSASIAGRDWVYGKGFSGAGKIEPDYKHLRYLILIGRSMGSAMGCLHSLNEARERGAQVVSVDPRMPDIAYGDAKWVPIRPGTDASFVLAMMNVMLQEGLADLKFLAKHTNAAYLIKADGRPLTEADMKAGGRKDRYAVHDLKTNRIVFQGVVLDEKGAAVGFDESADTDANLHFAQEVKLADGTTTAVRTALDILAEIAARHTPEASQKITGIPADELVRLAHNFANLKGVVDDGWYSSKNGNDIELYQLINILNAFNGNVDREGGIVVTAGGGFKRPGVAAGKGPNGEKWDMVDAKRIDKMLSPESAGNLWAALDAMITGKPYPIRALFTVGTTLFHRESDSTRLAKALKTLDLLVVQDLLPHEVCDYADYVLPATYFLERRETAGVKWALDGSVHMNDAGIRPPEGVEARHDVWILLEILRRAYPERAERVGYKECKTADEFDAWWNKFDDKGIAKFVKDQEAKNPGSGEKILADFKTKGWTTVNKKKYGVYPWKKPFGTPTGKIEIYGFKSFAKPGYEKIKPISDYFPAPAYTAPKPQSNEFVLVSGKNCTSSSGLNIFAATTRFTGDRTLWMNPYDAERLGIANKEKVMVEGVDREYQAEVVVTVTKKVMAGSVFAFGFSGGVRTKELVNDPRFDFVKEGINSHWFATGYAQPVVGNLANNSCIRVKRIKG